MPSALALTPLGVFHTAISLVAIAAGAWAFARDKVIVLNWLGMLYLATTALTAATGLMMFRHDAWRIGHSFSVLTLVVLTLLYAVQSRMGMNQNKVLQESGETAKDSTRK